MIEIDGALGEGGGQVLRSALSLSIITGKAFRINNIRARRSKTGLMAQHLKAVDASAAISRANVQGAVLGSSSLLFEPGEIRTGRYKFEIGTAGSTSLVLQTILLPLSLAGSASTVIISGGTHVPSSPSYHYLDINWRPMMQSAGYDFQLSLDQAGFYPQGGGRITATIRPIHRVAPLQVERRGELLRLIGISAVANLDRSIADRQKRQATGRLLRHFPSLLIKTISLPAQNKGTFLLLAAEFASGGGAHPARCCFCALGELGKPAERVADEAVDSFITFLQSGGAIDHHLADQLLLPLALASGPSILSSARITQHLLTNAEVIRYFLPVEIDIFGVLGEPGTIRIVPIPDR
ncbi:MAG: RNA 3'-terminal-phosphate cyclase [Chloroflexi bacterium RBG_16_52_11]|nr:MAG: RNA 3'-terminal-phosphate cyclase [Chloroflexi bacterium RBG_16_52_11]